MRGPRDARGGQRAGVCLRRLVRSTILSLRVDTQLHKTRRVRQDDAASLQRMVAKSGGGRSMSVVDGRPRARWSCPGSRCDGSDERGPLVNAGRPEGAPTMGGRLVSTGQAGARHARLETWLRSLRRCTPSQPCPPPSPRATNCMRPDSPRSSFAPAHQVAARYKPACSLRGVWGAVVCGVMAPRYR